MTYQDLINFQHFAQSYLNSKFTDPKRVYAVNKLLKRVKTLLEVYSEKLQDLEIKFAIEENGGLKREPSTTLSNGQVVPGIYVQSREDTQKRVEAVRVLTKTEVTIEPYFVPIPNDLPSVYVEVFTGFVFETQPDVEPSE